MASAGKLSVTMTSDMLHDIREAVRNGEFASTSEALRDAVRVWRRQRLEDAERLEVIRTRIRRSAEDPRPDLDEDEVDRHFADLHADALKAQRREKA